MSGFREAKIDFPEDNNDTKYGLPAANAAGKSPVLEPDSGSTTSFLPAEQYFEHRDSAAENEAATEYFHAPDYPDQAPDQAYQASFREQGGRAIANDTSFYRPGDDLPQQSQAGRIENKRLPRQQAASYSQRYQLPPEALKGKKKGIFRKGLSHDNLDLESQLKTGARLYRLKGYTTVDRVKRKFRQESQQSKIKNILTFLLILIIIIILLIRYNPVKDIAELRKILGLDSLYQTQNPQTTVESITDDSGEDIDEEWFPTIEEFQD